jgi:hypothetical protein
VWCRALLAVTVVAVLGGCAGDVAGVPTTSAGARPAIDPCTVLSDAELAQFGMQPETRRTVQELDAIGCGWRGQPFGLSLTTNPDTIAAYRERKDDPVFVSFAENEVNDRPGVQTQVAISGEQCAQAVGTWSGVGGWGAGRFVRGGSADRGADRTADTGSGELTWSWQGAR